MAERKGPRDTKDVSIESGEQLESSFPVSFHIDAIRFWRDTMMEHSEILVQTALVLEDYITLQRYIDSPAGRIMGQLAGRMVANETPSMIDLSQTDVDCMTGAFEKVHRLPEEEYAHSNRRDDLLRDFGKAKRSAGVKDK